MRLIGIFFKNYRIIENRRLADAHFVSVLSVILLGIRIAMPINITLIFCTIFLLFAILNIIFCGVYDLIAGVFHRFLSLLILVCI